MIFLFYLFVACYLFSVSSILVFVELSIFKIFCQTGVSFFRKESWRLFSALELQLFCLFLAASLSCFYIFVCFELFSAISALSKKNN